jgi:FKBP-type peptidyl-prolyl cis-trans isomerase 2
MEKGLMHMKTWIVMILAVLLLFGCVNPPQPPANATQPPAGVANSSPTVAPANTTLRPIAPGDSIIAGDTVWADYTLRVNGTVIDTTNATLANQSGIYNPARTYAPLQFVVAYNKGLITGFVNDVIGMQVNETESFAVDPARGYGFYDPAKVVTIPRYYNMNLFDSAPLSYFTQQGENISEGSAFNTPVGMVTVTNISGDNVTLFYMTLDTTPNYTFTNNGIPLRVAKVSNFTALIERTFEVNKMYPITNPSTGTSVGYLVTAKNDTNITLDSNNPLANKTLDFTVTIRAVERPS